MGKALYRKYRPTKLADVVGQDAIINNLQAVIEQDKISHAYIFTGHRGTGKTSVARIFAHAVNHFDYQLEDSYTDIIEIDAASNTGVDNIRELREKAAIAPTLGQYKVYIIDEVHMLSKSAFNALLKILEEPPKHVIFIMATTDPEKIPITILSRSQVFTFKLATPEVMLKHLTTIAQAEKIPITSDALELIVRRGGGSFRDSISLLDQISTLSNEKITAELITKALGLPQEQLISGLLDAYLEQNQSKITTLLKNTLNSGVKPETLTAELIKQILSKPEPNLLPLLNRLTEVNSPFIEAKLLVAFLLPYSNPTTSPFSPQPGSVPASRSTTSSSIPPINSTRSTPVSSHPNPLRAKLAARATKNAQATIQSQTADNLQSTIDNTSIASTLQNPSTVDNTSVVSASQNPNTHFNWSNFLSQISTVSPNLHTYLKKTKHHYDGQTLHLYPHNGIAKKLLSSDNNRKLLADRLSLPLIIHEHTEQPPTTVTTKPTFEFTEISAIMGGEIQEVSIDGESPF